MPTTKWFGRAKVRAEFRKPRAECNLALQRAAACILHASAGILSTALMAEGWCWVASKLHIAEPSSTSFRLARSQHLASSSITTLCSSMAASMRFCKECNNLLHPRENKAERQLYFACNRCAYKEEADASCVYQNYLVKATE
jgi:RNA polymerases M/15 Kd subunit